MRKFAFSLLVAALVLGSLPATPVGASPAMVTFHVYDKSGNRQSWASFRALQENGKGTNGDNDMLLDPTTLTVRKPWPLYQGGSGDPVFTWTGAAVTLAMAWPTSDGYSNLLLDIQAPGTFDFTFLAAQQGVAALDRMVAARPGYVASNAFALANQAAHGDLSAAGAASTESSQGAWGAQAYDAAVHATILLLTEYGTQYGRQRRAMGVPTVWGVTYDTVRGGTKALQLASTLVGPTPGNGWVRIVLDLAEPASYYVAAVTSAHSLGLHVVGEMLDSSDMSRQSFAQWQSRVNSYLSTLPSVDEWEVGNEVNGNWLGAGVVAKIAYAAQAVKARTKARTLLTLYYQLGEDDVAHSMFTWAHANLTATTMGYIDDLGLSLYPEDHPMGAALDRVLTTLHAAYPAQSLMITELDYWSADLGHTWTWGSVADPTGAGRQAVATYYSAAMLGYSWSRGGTFWWYFPEEAPAGGPLWTAMRSVYTAVNA
jgi:hypothetical protein